MEPCQAGDQTIKHTSLNDRWMFLRPMINSCKLHRTFKSPPDRTSKCSTREDHSTFNNIQLVCPSNQKKKIVSHRIKEIALPITYFSVQPRRRFSEPFATGLGQELS
uniref:Uncharacterized protein n=1 Tax=Knipowitschia caucasica TaxID=637954 RepID=A0AAV2LU89_KNICA